MAKLNTNVGSPLILAHNLPLKEACIVVKVVVLFVELIREKSLG